jgi:hypothetical protein
MSFSNYQKLLNFTDRTSADSNSSDDYNTLKDSVIELGGNGSLVPEKTVQQNADDIAQNVSDIAQNTADILTLQTGMPYGYIQGLNISNGTDTDHDIDIAAGRCKDSTGVYDLITSTGLTKQIDATWAAGTNAGGLDTGTVANSTWYYIWSIRKDSDGSTDVLFSTSATSPTMPSGYTYKRRIRGAVLTNGSANILGFFQKDNYFWWKTLTQDAALNNPGTSRVLTAVSSPPEMISMLTAVVAQIDANRNYVDFVSPDCADNAPLGYMFDSYSSLSNRQEMQLLIKTDSSSRIATRCSLSNASTYVSLHVYGFIDGAEL